MESMAKEHHVCSPPLLHYLQYLSYSISSFTHNSLYHREDIVVALWEHHAEKFDAEHYMKMAAQTTVVFLFVGVTCLMYNSKCSNSSYHVQLLYHI